MVSLYADKEVNAVNKVKIEGSLAVKEKKVIVIEAASHREEDKLRVAAYIRVSSDSTDQ